MASKLPLKGSRRLPCWLAAAALWLLLAASALAQPVAVPALDAPVVDTAGALDAATRQRLVERALALQQRKGSQLQVLVVPTTGGEPIEAYARRVFDVWRIGRQGVDDGVLLLVALNDRRVRIEPGYGLEGAVPDAVANRIIDEYLVPRFRAGDYAGGIDAASAALAGLIEGEPLPPPVSGHGRGNAPAGSPGLMVGVVLGLVAGSLLGGLLRPLPRLLRGGLAGIGAAVAGLLLVGGLGVALAAAVVAGLTALVGVTPAVFAGHGGWGRGGGWGGGMGGGGWGGGGMGGGWSGGGGMSGGGGASGSW